MLSGSGLVRCEDGADQDYKDAKRMDIDVQAGSWSVVGGHDCPARRIIKAPGAELSSWLEEIIIITVGSIGCSVFSLCQK
jgi:hypothetical protein